MIRQQANLLSSHRRRGVTMTEVLIAIMILGIGMTSLMTLFPIGLMKLREARRNNRASLLAENVASDLKARDLLNRYSFASTYSATGLTNGALFDAWSALSGAGRLQECGECGADESGLWNGLAGGLLL